MSPRRRGALAPLCGTVVLAGWIAAGHFVSPRIENTGAPIAGIQASITAGAGSIDSPQATIPQAAIPQAAIAQATIPQAAIPQAAVPQAAIAQATIMREDDVAVADAAIVLAALPDPGA